MRIVIIVSIFLSFWTASAQTRISDFGKSKNNYTYPSTIFKIGHIGLFLVNDSTGNRNAWISDGTDAGSRIILSSNSIQNTNEFLYTYLDKDSILFEFNKAIYAIGKALIPRKISDIPLNVEIKTLIVLDDHIILKAGLLINTKTGLIQRDAQIERAFLYSNGLYNPQSKKCYFNSSDGNKLLIYESGGNKTKIINTKEARLNFYNSSLFTYQDSDYFFSQNENQANILKILADTIEIIPTKIVSNQLQIVIEKNSIRFLNIINDNLIVEGFDGSKTFIEKSIPLNSKLDVNYQVRTIENTVYITGNNADGISELLSVNLDDNMVSNLPLPKPLPYANLIKSQDPDFLIIEAYLGNKNVKYRLRHSTKKIVEIDARWTDNFMSTPNGIIGQVDLGKLSDFSTDVNAPTRYGLGFGDKNISFSRKIFATNYSPFISIFPVKNEEKTVLTGHLDGSTFGFFQIENQKMKLIHKENAKLDSIRVLVYSDGKIEKNLELNYFDIVSENYKTINIDAEKSEVSIINIENETIGLTIFKWKDGENLYAINNTNQLYVTSSKTKETKFLRTLKNFKAAYVSTNIEGNYFYGQTNEMDKDSIFRQNYIVYDWQNDIAFSPLSENMIFAYPWNNLMIIFTKNKIYAADKKTPYKVEFLHEFINELKFDSYFLAFSKYYFEIIVDSEYFFSNGNCEESQTYFINTQVSGPVRLEYKYNLLNKKSLKIFTNKVFLFDNKNTTQIDLKENILKADLINDRVILFSYIENDAVYLAKYTLDSKTIDVLSSKPRKDISIDYVNYIIDFESREYSFFRFGTELWHIQNSNLSIKKLEIEIGNEEYYIPIIYFDNTTIISLKSGLYGVKNQKAVKIDETETLVFQNYLPKYENTKYVYLNGVNASSLIRVDKETFSYKIIIGKPEWQRINRIFQINNDIYTIVTEYGKGQQIWLVDTATDALSQSKNEPEEILFEAKNCKTDNLKEESDLLIYPNPSSDVLNVLLDEKDEDIDLEIYTLKGQRIYTNPIQNRRSYFAYPIEIKTLVKGEYILVYHSQGSKKFQRFIKN